MEVDLLDPPETTPAWLAKVVQANRLEDPLPLRALLSSSIYYPSSRLCGLPIKHYGRLQRLTKRITHKNLQRSFVYCDYDVSQNAFTQEVHQIGLRGFSLFGMRAVREQELWPVGYPTTQPTEKDGRIDLYARRRQQPFWATWAVFCRDGDGAGRSPTLLSLLFIGGEAVSVYERLYARLGVGFASTVLCLVQPGYGLGGGWSPLQQCGGFFHRAAEECLPGFILSGGYHKFYNSPVWGYEHLVEHIVRSRHRAAQLWCREEVQPL